MPSNSQLACRIEVFSCILSAILNSWNSTCQLIQLDRKDRHCLPLKLFLVGFYSKLKSIYCNKNVQCLSSMLKKLKWHHDFSWNLFDKVSDNVVAFLDNFLNPCQSKTVDADNKIQLFLNFIKWKKIRPTYCEISHTFKTWCFLLSFLFRIYDIPSLNWKSKEIPEIKDQVLVQIQPLI